MSLNPLVYYLMCMAPANVIIKALSDFANGVHDRRHPSEILSDAIDILVFGPVV